MNAVEYNVLHLLHVAALLILGGYTFYAFAAPQESRKRVLMITGIATLVVLLTGIRMWQAMFTFTISGWIVIKLLCWLVISALSGMAYRRREQAGKLIGLTVVVLVVAVSMVYLKPF